MNSRLVKRWHARAPRRSVDEWLSGYKDIVFPHMRDIDGCLGVSIQVSNDDDPREITVLTYWDGPDALAEFAGPEPEKAVMPEWVARILPDHDTFATHHDEVLLEDFR